MGLQFCNINRTAYVKPVTRIKTTSKVTSPKKKKYSRRKQVDHSLTADNLAFLRSLNAI